MAVAVSNLSATTVDSMLALVTHTGVSRDAGSVMLGSAGSTVVPFCRAAGGCWPDSRIVGHGHGVLGLFVDGLVHGAALVALEDPGHALRGGVLSDGRDRLGLDAGRLEVGDHRVGEPVVGLDGGVDLRVGGDACWKMVPPLVLSQPGAKFSATSESAEAVGRAAGDRLGLLAPDHLVVTRGEGDRVRSRCPRRRSARRPSGLAMFHALTHASKPWPICSPTSSLLKLT